MKKVAARSCLLIAVLAGSCLALAPAALAQEVGAKGGQPAAGKTAEQLPIQRITLYRSGVGYFQRGASVGGDQRVPLKFDVAQINDVLKSIQVLDKSGAPVSVSYASKDPLSRRLASFGVPIADNPSLPALLERLRGSAVDLATTDGKVSGTVLSVEVRKVASGAGDKAVVVDTPFVNLVTSAGIKSVAIPGVMSMTLSDAQLQSEINRALSAIADSRAERVKTVDIALAGQAARDVIVAYVHETPVWKTSYRLVLPESFDAKPEAKEAKPQGVMQGWAIVENTTDNDWSNVRLSLVSGRPVSFKMDLYEPMYVWRPDVAVPTVAGVMPKEYAGSTAAAKPVQEMERRVSRGLSSAATPAPAAMPAAPGRPGGGGGGDVLRDLSESKMKDASAAYSISGADMADYAPKSVAKGGEVGEQFQFEVGAPITIERQRSAMIPIINANVEARRVSIYNMNDRADHPMRGVEVSNTTGGQLLPGPLAVFDGASYAGDAQIGQVSAGDKRLLAYALDLDVAVTTTPKFESNISKIRIVDGMLEQTIVSRNEMKYAFDNKDLKRSRNIVLEQEKMPGWELKTPAKADETTQTLYRFDLGLEAGKLGEFTVVQERTELQRLGVMNYDVATILLFQQQGKLSEAVAQAIREAAKRQATIADLERQVTELDRQLTTVKADQEQVTTMMNRLDRNNENYATLNQRLKDRLAKVEKLEQQRTTAGEQLEAARRSLNDFISKLNVE
ncbi:MAG: hypothetical protein ACREJO_00215 [Phycisphaerales bacterium]